MKLVLAGGSIGTPRARGARLAVLAAVVVALLLLPLVVADPYLQGMVILLFMWVVLGQAWNLLGGYAGQMSFGHSAFFGLGAYTSSLLFLKLGISPWLGLIPAAVVAAACSIPIGLICFRLRGPYFALTTLAFAEILRIVATNERELTRGSIGLILPIFFPDKAPYYYIMLGLMLLSLYVTYRVVRSRLGHYFVAIREDQDAAESLGLDSTRYKLIALMISAALTGAAGSFYASYVTFIDPAIVFSTANISLGMLLVSVLGGLGTFSGPIVGVGVFLVLSEVFRRLFLTAHAFILGFLLVAVIVFLPEGIVGRVRAFWRARVGGAARRPAPTGTARPVSSVRGRAESDQPDELS